MIKDSCTVVTMGLWNINCHQPRACPRAQDGYIFHNYNYYISYRVIVLPLTRMPLLCIKSLIKFI